MKRKTINSVICKKFDEWIESIEDENVKSLVEKNTVITGGCIASMLLHEKVNDFDVYFRDKETTLAVARYYVEVFNRQNSKDFEVIDGAKKDKTTNSGILLNLTEDRIKIYIPSAGISIAGEKSHYEFGMTEDQEDIHGIVEGLDDFNASLLESNHKYIPSFLSANAITLTGQIQIVIRFYGEPHKIHDNYDFVHCTNYWDSKSRKVFLHEEALESLLTKELIYIGSKYPVCSLIRVRKFVKRGWSINAGQMLKMQFQVSALDLTNVETLEDQLTGVDFAFFYQIIENLKVQKEKDPNFTVSFGYIATIIDKIF